jgi:hypothetical protein
MECVPPKTRICKQFETVRHCLQKSSLYTTTCSLCSCKLIILKSACGDTSIGSRYIFEVINMQGKIKIRYITIMQYRS